MKLVLKIFLINLLSAVILSNCTTKNVLLEPRIILKEMADFKADGNFDEWEERNTIPLFCNQTGVVPDSGDLNASFKLAYNNSKLLFYFNIEDDIEYSDTLYPWNGDATELFIAPYKGSKEFIQISISQTFSKLGEPFIRIDYSAEVPNTIRLPIVFGKRNNGVTEMEGEIELAGLLLNENTPSDFALQVYVDDSDKRRDENKWRLTWFNNNYSSASSFSYFPVQLGGEKEYLPTSTARIKIVDEDSLFLRFFGMMPGDEIKVYHSSKKRDSILIEEIISSPAGEYIISNPGIDYLKDELFVFQNNKCISYHNLLLAPREYLLIDAPPFYEDIRRFMAYDKLAFPEPGATLFIGSSSIRKWNSLKDDFPELDIIHRGFGGSTSANALQYINQIVLPYKAKRIVYYEGDNDVAKGFEIDSIVANIKKFIEIVQADSPETEIFILSPKPAISRLSYYHKYRELHKKMNIMTEKKAKITFVDVATPMFLSDGTLDQALFLEDNLHMNEKGYQIWTAVLREKMGLSK